MLDVWWYIPVLTCSRHWPHPVLIDLPGLGETWSGGTIRKLKRQVKKKNSSYCWGSFFFCWTLFPDFLFPPHRPPAVLVLNSNETVSMESFRLFLGRFFWTSLPVHILLNFCGGFWRYPECQEWFFLVFVVLITPSHQPQSPFCICASMRTLSCRTLGQLGAGVWLKGLGGGGGGILTVERWAVCPFFILLQSWAV